MSPLVECTLTKHHDLSRQRAAKKQERLRAFYNGEGILPSTSNKRGARTTSTEKDEDSDDSEGEGPMGWSPSPSPPCDFSHYVKGVSTALLPASMVTPTVQLTNLLLALAQHLVPNALIKVARAREETPIPRLWHA